MTTNAPITDSQQQVADGSKAITTVPSPVNSLDPETVRPSTSKGKICKYSYFLSLVGLVLVVLVYLIDVHSCRIMNL